MRIILVCIWSFFTFSNTFAQGIPDGLWNAGGIIIPSFSGKNTRSQPAVRNAEVRIDLYPGVSVAGSRYDIYNTDSSSMECHIEVRDSSRYRENATGMVFIRKPALARAFINDSLVTPMYDSINGISLWKTVIPPGDSIRFRILQLTENYQSKLVAEGNTREANAMVLMNERPQQFYGDSIRVKIRLRESLTATSILGLSPAKKFYGDINHLYCDIKGSPMVIWYEGLAGDFNFNKKILPKADELFSAMETFPDAEFSDPNFPMVDKYNFSVNPRNPLAAIVYFLMFFAPWAILIAFIIFLLRKPRKKNIQA